MTVVRYEIDARYSYLVIRKIRPVWAWERELKLSAPETDDERCMAVFTAPTLGL